MVTARARIDVTEERVAVVPVVLPVMEDLRAFAQQLHARDQAWDGEAFGWPAEYFPEKAMPPLDSRLTFTPAEFCIGESGVWFFSLMWERGKDEPPSEYLDDSHIVAE